jgi:hypothetical protein
MNADALTVTIEAKPRPWWRPLSVRALRRWYQEARRGRRHGRLFSAAVALVIARKEFRIADKATAL